MASHSSNTATSRERAALCPSEDSTVPRTPRKGGGEELNWRLWSSVSICRIQPGRQHLTCHRGSSFMNEVSQQADHQYYQPDQQALQWTGRVRGSTERHRPLVGP